ncbi:MAG: hypothetical protein NVS3B21_16290 [Acidimicrobiales bacterium]
MLYVRDTLLGRVQPNRVTWVLWAAGPLIAFGVEIDAGVGLRALIALSTGLGPLVVFVASFVNPRAYWRTTRLDWACGVVALAALVCYLATRQGVTALLLSLAADALAGVPTIRKAWTHPETERVNVYLGSLVNAIMTLLTVQHLAVEVVLFPAYIAAGSLTGVLIVGVRGARRRRTAPPVERSPRASARVAGR